MSKANKIPGQEAVQEKGWYGAHKWLIRRRVVQLSILLLFLLGPWAGLWIVKGNLNASMTLEVLPLTDPYVLLQSMLAGFWPEQIALSGAVIVIVAYLLLGGRVYCSWVCPINIVSDTAGWLRSRLRLKGGLRLSRSTRYWLLAMTLIVSLLFGVVAWELINPISMLHRGILFGMGMGWVVILAVFLFELGVSPHGWCGRLCPVGAFYGLLTIPSVVRITANNREQCDDCTDCLKACPEPQVITPALKGASKGFGPMIRSASCTNCARCIDVCSKDVFRFTTRFNDHNHVQLLEAKEIQP